MSTTTSPNGSNTNRAARTPLSLVVLAAGMGSRYGGLKQVDPVGPNGEIVVDYSVHDALRAGFGKLVFVIRREIEKEFRAAIGSRYEKRCDVHYAFQALDDLPAGFAPPPGRDKPWGTGHALLAARKTVGEPFAVINADDFYGADGYRLLAAHLASLPPGAADYALVGFVLRNTLSAHGTVSRGVCRCSESGMLLKVTELTRIAPAGEGAVHTCDDGQTVALSGDELVSMNMWGFTPALLEHLEARFREFLAASGSGLKAEFYLPAAVDAMIACGLATVRVLPSRDPWFGITYREDKPQVAASIRKLIADGAYPTPI